MKLTQNSLRRVFMKSGAKPVFAAVIAGLICLVCLKTDTMGFEDQSSEVGLTGLLVDVVPEDISEESFDVLGEGHKKWSAETSALLVKLYEEPPADIAGQTALLKSLAAKVAELDGLISSEKDQSVQDGMVDLQGKLSRRVDLATAVLNTLELDPAAQKTAQLEQAKTKIAADVKNLGQYLNSLENGPAWLTYVRAGEIEKVAQSGSMAKNSQKVLLAVKKLFNSREKLELESQREFFSRKQFINLEKSVDEYLTLAQAPVQGSNVEKLRDQLAELLTAVENHEESHSFEDSQAVRNAYTALKGVAPDGGDLVTEAMRYHYFNYNVRVTASEDFLNRIVETKRVEEGEVDDFILGAVVTGEQTTHVTAGLNLKPSDSTARLDVTLTGVTDSNTTGVTDQATVYTQGHHTFRATKEINFDGLVFSTKKAKISVNANNNTYDAQTNLPLFNGIGRGIALREANRRRGQSEAIAIQRVTDRVLPEFNKEVDANFKNLNGKLETEIFTRLKDAGLFPSAYSYQTTDDHLFVSTRLMSKGELGGSTLNENVVANSGLTVQIHESQLNNSLDRLKLAGKTLTEDELITELEKSISDSIGRNISIPKSKKDSGPNTLAFADADPIRFDISAGVITLTLRAGFKQAGKEDIPTQVIKVPLTFKVEGDEISIERGTMQVSAAVRPKSLAKQITQAGIIRKKIQSALPNRKVSRKFSTKIDNGGEERELNLAIAEIKALDGWLTIVIK